MQQFTVTMIERMVETIESRSWKSVSDKAY